MAEERQPEAPVTRGKSVDEQLESLNEEMRRKGPGMMRRILEADIEEKAKRRQKDEESRSSGS